MTLETQNLFALDSFTSNESALAVVEFNSVDTSIDVGGCSGTAGTLGSFGTACGCLGTFGTAGSYGCSAA